MQHNIGLYFLEQRHQRLRPTVDLVNVWDMLCKDRYFRRGALSSQPVNLESSCPKLAADHASHVARDAGDHNTLHGEPIELAFREWRSQTDHSSSGCIPGPAPPRSGCSTAVSTRTPAVRCGSSLPRR